MLYVRLKTLLVHLLFTTDLTSAILCTIVFLKRSEIAFNIVQNALACAVVAAPKSSNPDHTLKSLHCLKVQERIKYKVISSTYKLLQSSPPRYLRDLITVQPSQSLNHPHWSLFSNHQLTPVSKSQTAPSGSMLHLTCTNFLLFVFLISLVHHHHPALLHHHALISWTGCQHFSWRFPLWS